MKHGITSFNFVIYYYHEDPAVILTDVETKVIQSFPFEELFNFKKEADSMLGYKHTAEAIEKMKLRFVDKTPTPMYLLPTRSCAPRRFLTTLLINQMGGFEARF